LGTEKTKGQDAETIMMVQDGLATMHLCGSAQCHGALGNLVVAEWEARAEEVSSAKLKEIANSLKTFYLKEPFNRWFATATGVAGIPADTQHGESANAKTQRSILINKRQSKEHLLRTGIPRILVLDGAHYENVKMELEPQGYATQNLARAHIITTEGKYAIRVPKKGNSVKAPYPEGTTYYFNSDGNFEASFKNEKAVNKRIKQYEDGLKGKIGDCNCVADFKEQFLGLNSVEKVSTPTGPQMQCKCKRYAQEKQCPHSCAAESLDGTLDTGSRLEHMPANKTAGRPKKTVGALMKQPLDKQHKPTLRGGPTAPSVLVSLSLSNTVYSSLPPVYSPSHLLSYSPTHLLTYSPTHLLSYSPTQLFTYSPAPTYSVTHPLTY
jgi:hypothetical protein